MIERLVDLPPEDHPGLAAAQGLLRAARTPDPGDAGRKRRVWSALHQRRQPVRRLQWAAAAVLVLLLGSVALARALGWWGQRGWEGGKSSSAPGAPAPLAPAAAPSPPVAPQGARTVTDEAPPAPQPPQRSAAVPIRAGGRRGAARPSAAPPDTAEPAKIAAPSAPVADPAPAAAIAEPAAASEAEAALVLAAVRALRGEHDARRAGVLLDDYLRRYPTGSLAEEALALAIEAAVQRGDPAVTALAADYLRRYPTGRFRPAAVRAQRSAAPGDNDD